ncbi:MAG TPA: hypothetical protein VMW49_09185 [Candidatus Dormibacteraeota bacterium]|nr:hypothetical protein [Candidatus Dormibacteraeota bacterium]
MPGRVPPAGEARTLRAVVGLAQFPVAAQLQTADSDDGTAIGPLTIDAALAAALAGVRAAPVRLPGLWWLPLQGFLAVAGGLVVALWPRQFDTGPDPEAFVGAVGGMAAAEALRNRLGALQQALEGTSARLQTEGRFFRWGLGWRVGPVGAGTVFLGVAVLR